MSDLSDNSDLSDKRRGMPHFRRGRGGAFLCDFSVWHFQRNAQSIICHSLYKGFRVKKTRGKKRVKKARSFCCVPVAVFFLFFLLVSRFFRLPFGAFFSCIPIFRREFFGISRACRNHYICIFFTISTGRINRTYPVSVIQCSEFRKWFHLIPPPIFHFGFYFYLLR